MATKLKWAIRLFGVALAIAPAFVSVARADDSDNKPTTQAEGAAGRPKRAPGEMLKKLHDAVTALNLSDEQKPKIEEAFADAKTKFKEAVKDANGDRQAMREKIMPIRQELMKTIKGILTPEQQAELEKALPKPGERGKGAAGKPPQN